MRNGEYIFNSVIARDRWKITVGIMEGTFIESNRNKDIWESWKSYIQILHLVNVKYFKKTPEINCIMITQRNLNCSTHLFCIELAMQIYMWVPFDPRTIQTDIPGWHSWLYSWRRNIEYKESSQLGGWYNLPRWQSHIYHRFHRVLVQVGDIPYSE